MKTILRNFRTTLMRFKLASALNIIGLSIAFAAFMVIMMQVRHDRTFDSVHPNADRLYRVASMNSQTQGMVYVSRAAFDTYTTLSPGIDQATLVAPPWRTSYIKVEKNGTQTGFVEDIQYTFPAFAEMFSLDFVDGSNTIAEPDKVIIPQSLALKFFGTTQAVGQLINIDSQSITNGISGMATIGGVFRDFPENSQIPNTIYALFPDNTHKGVWGASNYLMYATLHPGYTVEKVHEDFKKFDQKSAFDYIIGLRMIPLKEVYFDPTSYYGDDAHTKKGNPTTTTIMLAIAILIVVIAAINFVNFSTSLAPLRMRSINAQKVFGCPTATLRTALVAEAIGIAAIAYALSLFWIYGLEQGPFRDIIQAGVSFSRNVSIIGWSAALAVAVGLVAGIYPAFYATKFPPALVLKGSFAMSSKGRALRTTLIGVQFVISIALIIAATFMQIQNRYMRNMDTGMKRDQIAVIQLGGELLKQKKAFDEKLTANPSIAGVAYSQFKIGGDNNCQGWRRNLKGESVDFGALLVTWNFPQMMGMELIEGQWFSQDDQYRGVENNYIFNQTAARDFKLTAPMRVNMKDSVYSDVRGIVRDFNFRSLQQGVSPTALVVVGAKGWQTSLSYGYVKIIGDPFAAVEYISQTAASIDPAYPITIEFYDAVFDALYRGEIKTTQLISLASLLAVIISLIGVFGLVVFETQYRRKEIGVRKVHGATIGQILMMFNIKFIYIVLICSAIAIPTAYMGISIWLGGFAYRTPLHWYVFALGGIIVLAITLLTVTIQSYRAANENPVKSLKSE